MPRLILPSADMKRLLRRRRLMGGDRYDEVWNGVYVMSPLADNSHQHLVGRLTMALDHVLPPSLGAFLLPGCNVSDDAEKWTRNYRCPDVVAFLPGNPAEDRGSHYLGGPDFAVEILSPGDRARKKFAFYARAGVRELLLIDRTPWRLELYRSDRRKLLPVGVSTPADPTPLASSVLPVTFRLVLVEPRPQVEVAAIDGTHRRLA